ncbi:hypothetical protein GGH17_003753 [Coemansia sp. RSA 788]|nr:hypothetical protein GGH17_003753 [Coemansia sp. RSA 788]
MSIPTRDANSWLTQVRVNDVHFAKRRPMEQVGQAVRLQSEIQGNTDPDVLLRDPRAGPDAGGDDPPGAEPMQVEDLLPHPPDPPGIDQDHAMADL